MEDRDFRVGDNVTCLILGHGEVVDDDGIDHCSINVRFENSEVSCYAINGKWDDDSGRVLFHGHLDLDDIKKYIESKEQIPVRKVTKYINVWNRPGKGLVCSGLPYNTEEDAKKAAGKSNRYVLIAQPIEVTE